MTSVLTRQRHCDRCHDLCSLSYTRRRAKQFKPKTKTVKQLRDMQRLKTLSVKAPTGGGGGGGQRGAKSKNKPPSVSAQFNVSTAACALYSSLLSLCRHQYKKIMNMWIIVTIKMLKRIEIVYVFVTFQYSLQKLMETLFASTPFFVRCIKSNMDKRPCKFDDAIVLRQLRYTGMLATVRIRQSGYNYRVTFEAFRLQYRILLPKGSASQREDLQQFLLSMELNQNSFQIGATKVARLCTVETLCCAE